MAGPASLCRSGPVPVGAGSGRRPLGGRGRARGGRRWRPLPLPGGARRTAPRLQRRRRRTREGPGSERRCRPCWWLPWGCRIAASGPARPVDPRFCLRGRAAYKSADVDGSEDPFCVYFSRVSTSTRVVGAAILCWYFCFFLLSSLVGRGHARGSCEKTQWCSLDLSPSPSCGLLNLCCDFQRSDLPVVEVDVKTHVSISCL